ncbi:ankyrin repeat domain-containing protein [bacterium]|nr:ankyrin repeat domain-containing protein [bacterium]
MTARRSLLLGLGSLRFLTAAVLGADPEPTTLALILATGDRAPAVAVRDRLEAAWLTQPGVALVERAQLEKILAEYQLTGAALVDPAKRVLLGQFVPAELLVFLDSIPRLPQPATRIQVTESKTGIVLASGIFEDEALLQNPQAGLDLVRVAVAKRAVPEKERHVLGYLDFRSAESGLLLEGTAAALGTLVITELARAPDLIVLEREHLQHLQTERDLTKLEQDLRASVRLLEGGVSRSADSSQLAVAISLRPIGAGEPLRASLQVATNDLVAAQGRIVAKIAELLLARVPERGTADRLAEAGVFARQAALWTSWGDRQRAIQAAETAFALDSSQSNRLLLALTLTEGVPSLADVIRGNRIVLDYYRLQELVVASGGTTNLALPSLGYWPELAQPGAAPEDRVLRQELDRAEEEVFRYRLGYYRKYYDRVGVEYWNAWRERLHWLAPYASGRPNQQVRLVREAVEAFTRPPAKPDWLPSERFEMLNELPPRVQGVVHFIGRGQRLRAEGRSPGVSYHYPGLAPGVFDPLLQELAKHPDPYVRVMAHQARFLKVMWRQTPEEEQVACETSLEILRIIAEELPPAHPYRQIRTPRCTPAHMVDFILLRCCHVFEPRYLPRAEADRFVAQELEYVTKMLRDLVATGDPDRLQSFYSYIRIHEAWLDLLDKHGRFADALELTRGLVALRNKNRSPDDPGDQPLETRLQTYERLHRAMAEQPAEPVAARPAVPPNDPGWEDFEVRPLDLQLPRLVTRNAAALSSVQMVSRGNRLYCVVPVPKERTRVDLQLTVHWLPSGEILSRREVPVGLTVEGAHWGWEGLLHAVTLGDDDRVYVGTRKGLIVISSASNHWERITEKEGLPGTIVRTLAWHDGRLYVAIGCDPYECVAQDRSALAAYDPGTKTWDVIASEKGVGGKNPWDGTRFSIEQFLSDPEHDCLWIRELRQGVWRYVPRTRTLEPVVPRHRLMMLVETGAGNSQKTSHIEAEHQGSSNPDRAQNAPVVNWPEPVDGQLLLRESVTVARDSEDTFFAGLEHPDRWRWFLILTRPNQPPSLYRQLPDGQPFPGAWQLHPTTAGVVVVTTNSTALLIRRKANETRYRLAELEAASGDARETRLLNAADAGNRDQVDALLQAGAKVNAVDFRGWTPLHHALDRNRTDTALLLLERGADPTRPNEAGGTPLFVAAGANECRGLTALLKRRVEVDTPAQDGVTPLLFAVRRGHTEAVRLLLDAGADLQRRPADSCRSSCLIEAAGRGYREIVKVLVEHGARLEDLDQCEYTPLMRAASQGHLEVINELLTGEAQVDGASRIGWTPLMEAVQKQHLPAVRLLVEAGARVNHRDDRGVTPLIIAAQESTPEIVRYLLDHRADVSAQTRNQLTPLIAALKHNRLELIRMLLEAGADPEQAARFSNDRVVRPVDYAKSPEARALIQQAIAERNPDREARP